MIVPVPEGITPLDHLPGAELVTIRSFGSEPEALVAKSVLEAFGVDCMISSDDCGGQRIHLAISEGIRLMVRSDDTGRAEEVLSAQIRETDSEETNAGSE